MFAVGVWLGVGLHSVPWAVLIVVIGVLALKSRLGALCAVACAAGLAVGGLGAARIADGREMPIPSDHIEVRGVAVSDSTDSVAGFGSQVLVVRPLRIVTGGGGAPWRGPDLLVRGGDGGIMVGEPVRVAGAIDSSLRSYRGRPIGGVLEARSVVRLGSAPNLVLAFGNAVRRRVLGSLDEASRSPRGALLSGFLIGAIERLPPADVEALRLAGLSHYVAVSGSNVALFLAAWWLVGGPLGVGPRRRALFGLVGIAVFVVVTRWEPSVVRAALMAGLVLVGRLAGRPVGPWGALGGATAAALLVAPGLAGSYGFALSVCATAGIIAGSSVWSGRSPRPVWAVLGATISAQMAVAPLLFLWFGSVALLAPVSNLLAAPLVAASTAVGGIGAVTGWNVAIAAGGWLAGVVLGIAHVAAGLPRVSRGSAVPVAAVIALCIRYRWLRPVGAVAAIVIVAVGIAPTAPPERPVVAFLDVGQGDATMFRGPDGETILVDGGPDPLLLRRYLSEFGIGHIDLLVISHRHADHVVGLSGVFESTRVGMVWYPDQLGESAPLDELIAAAREAGVPAVVPNAGDVLRIGTFRVAALGPLRRYSHPNDGSVVVAVSTGETSVMMTGDIEVTAQHDLGPLRATVLKVPHQGAATSDLDWLARSAPQVAVISVGPNDYGHPAAPTIEALERAGSLVLRTDVMGTITIPLGGADGVGRLPSSR